MDLPSLWTIPFLHGNRLARLRASPFCHVGTGIDSPARIACWPTAIVRLSTLTLSRDRHEGGQRDGQRRNVMLPLHAMILYVVNDERHWRGNGSFHFLDQSFAESIADES